MVATPRSVPMKYRCGDCHDVHSDEVGALDCCPVRITEVYLCPVCDEDHLSESDALQCWLECAPEPIADADPDVPLSSRGPTGVELEMLGQTRLFA